MVEKICYTRCNGADPLVAKPIIRLLLNYHFGGSKWHFTTDAHHFHTTVAEL